MWVFWGFGHIKFYTIVDQLLLNFAKRLFMNINLALRFDLRHQFWTFGNIFDRCLFIDQLRQRLFLFTNVNRLFHAYRALEFFMIWRISIKCMRIWINLVLADLVPVFRHSWRSNQFMRLLDKS